MKKLKQLPMPPTSGLLLGHLTDLQKPTVHQTMLDWVEEYGNYFRLRLGWKNVLVIGDC